MMKQRAMRGLEKPKDMGISRWIVKSLKSFAFLNVDQLFFRIFSSLLKCSADCKPAIIGGSKRTE